MASEITKPRSFLRYDLDLTQAELVKETYEVKPRHYFRGSEAGNCPRQIYYAMKGERPRPEDVPSKLRQERGNAMHDLLHRRMDKRFVTDGTEGKCSHDLWLHITESLEKSGRANEVLLVEREDQDNTWDIHVKWVHKQTPLELHFRPDDVFRGIRLKGGDELWPDPMDWELTEYKSTTSWGLGKAKKTCSEPDRPYGWYPQYVDQVQLSMHFMCLQHARVLQAEPNFMDMVMDDLQDPSPRSKLPQWQWQVIPYDGNRVTELFDKMVMITEHLKAGMLPGSGLCPGVKGDLDYNMCSFNAEEVAGHTSAPLCRGIVGG